MSIVKNITTITFQRKMFSVDRVLDNYYYLIARLHPAVSDKASGLVIEITSRGLSVNGKSKLFVTLGNRYSFWYIKSYHGTGSYLHVRVYEQIDGSHLVYVYVKTASYTCGEVVYYQNGWLNSLDIYDAPQPTTSTPPGTLVFDSSDETNYPVNETIAVGALGVLTTSPSKAISVKEGQSGGDILCYDIYTHDGGIHASDERDKTNISPISLGLEFIKALSPVFYKWKDTEKLVIEEEVEETVQATEAVEEEVEVDEIKYIDGKWTKVVTKKIETRNIPVFDTVPLYDEEGNIIGEHKVPRMITRKVIKQRLISEDVTYKRTHCGLIAQQVAEALKSLGLSESDLGMYCYEKDRDKHGVRYIEFIAPLIKAVQELSNKVDKLLEDK